MRGANDAVGPGRLWERSWASLAPACAFGGGGFSRKKNLSLSMATDTGGAGAIYRAVSGATRVPLCMSRE